MAGLAVLHRGRLIMKTMHGLADVERNRTFEEDAIVRVFSMTKPIVSAAAMLLVERAELRLDWPVESYLPCFKDMQVCVKSASGEIVGVEPAKRKITVQHLLTHTAGFTYDILPGELAARYKAEGVHFRELRADADEGRPGALLRKVEKLATLPLAAQPGEEFHYGVGIDVVGCIIEQITGMLLGDFLDAEIFKPLGMIDTGFHVPPDKAHRLAALYKFDGATGSVTLDEDATTSIYLTPHPYLVSGGGGLTSTMDDYVRFTAMLQGFGTVPSSMPGGGSRRILARTSVEFMMRDHLPPGVPMPKVLHCHDGNGFGIGGSVVVSPARNALPGSVGQFSWGGLANTYMNVDPIEELAFVFFTQVKPSFGLCQWRRDLQALVEACVDD